ncbi:hypothetical protein [Aliarcobacter skirrowii]|uniref:hypothetical protein n=1 Tax=Aliarcobacter skirrowii TaxID=28200 RepID=UPI000826EF67|nr:hypothetical protein [Aliarcobacter skirrowii]
MNNYYEELISYKKDEIKDFFKNTKLFDSQFKYDSFNETCNKKMFIENNQTEIKTVKNLKEEISELKDICKACGTYFMNPRNKSIKGLDVQLGRFLEKCLMDYMSDKLNLKAIPADNKNKSYPDCMVLDGNKGIIAYFEVKYHGAPFIYAIQSIKRFCYEGSATLDYKKVIKQLELIDSDLDRPTFYIHWIDYPCLKGIFFETSEQVKHNIYNDGPEFDRKEREGDYKTIHKIGYTEKIYSPLLEMGTFEEFINILKDLKKNGVIQQ